LRAIEHLTLEEGNKFSGASHSSFGLDLAHAGLLVVGDMAEVHHTGQGPGKAGRKEFPSADKELHKVTMDTFVGPFAPSHPPPL
jgi:hypothetical protein